MAYRRVALIDLYLQAKFRSNQKKFCGQTDVWICRLTMIQAF